ncbi:MAG: DUF1003 domain-containing protein [Rhizobiaceae bacterium]|nr:DUF1003 domain-containing protein [Rhizobiaceae bacterium]
MTKTPFDLARRFFSKSPDHLTDVDSRVLQSALDRRTITRDTNAVHASVLSAGDRIADGLARIGGSWGFILSFLAFLFAWTLGNAYLLHRDAFDPFPFIFLNLVLSMLAALQAPVIMMSQNRQAARDRLDAAHDYEVNLKAEIEIMALHEKFDEIRHKEILALREEVAEVRTLLSRIDQKLSGAAAV